MPWRSTGGGPTWVPAGCPWRSCTPPRRDPAKGPLLATSGLFRPLASFGRFGVWHLLPGGGGWAEPVAAGPAVLSEAPGPGRFLVEVPPSSSPVIVKTTFHPSWRGAGAPAADPRTGLLVLRRPVPGRHELVWQAPRWPPWISVLGVLAAGALVLRSR